MIPVSLYSLYIVIDDILEAFKTDVFKVLYVHVFSPELSETSLDIFTVLDHVFNVLKAFKAWPLSKLIVPSIFYYAPIVEVWLKDVLLLSFDHGFISVLNRVKHGRFADCSSGSIGRLCGISKGLKCNSISLDLLLISNCLRFLIKLINMSTNFLVSCSQEGVQLIDFELLFLQGLFMFDELGVCAVVVRVVVLGFAKHLNLALQPLNLKLHICDLFLLINQKCIFELLAKSTKLFSKLFYY